MPSRYQVPQGLPLNEYGVGDMRYYTEQDWIDAGNAGGIDFCRVCFKHPGPGQGWGKDCPHGYWITPDRFSAQRNDYIYRVIRNNVLLVVVASYWLRVSAFTWFTLAIIWICQYVRYRRRLKKAMASIAIRLMHPELQPPGWFEKTKKHNHPWDEQHIRLPFYPRMWF